MPVPEILTNPATAHVFRYAADLQQACQRLQERIAGGNPHPPLTTVNTQQDPATFGGAPAVNQNSRVAWLVGHGRADSENIGTATFAGYPLSIDAIVEWLANQQYTHVVDTCCQPNLRRAVNRRGMAYYCARDNQIVTLNQGHQSLDDWWDHNGFRIIEELPDVIIGL